MGAENITPFGRATDFELVSNTWVTTNTAFGALSAVADLVGYFDGERLTSHPTSDVSAGRLIIGPAGQSLLRLKPVGVGADNETGDFRLWLWERINNPAASKGPVQWSKNLLAVGSFTLCAKVGVAGGHVPATARYADTITLSSDRSLLPDQVRILQASAPDDSPASLVIDPLGQILEVECRRNTIATSLNWLRSWMSN